MTHSEKLLYLIANSIVHPDEPLDKWAEEDIDEAIELYKQEEITRLREERSSLMGAHGIFGGGSNVNDKLDEIYIRLKELGTEY